jgi:pantoate--beta-alanine ligase
LIVHRSVESWVAVKHGLYQESLGFVPTMGNLHSGHTSLISKARKECDVVLLSIFVNPTQFDDPCDLAQYPRTLQADLELAKENGVDHVLLPEADQIYSDGYTYQVHESKLSQSLCGLSRPGHFDGVLSVVMNLLQIAQSSVDPTKQRAYFGEKDLQQLVLIRDMVRAFFLPWTIVSCPTVRESDGLAMSSRNSRLTDDQRSLAPLLYRTLRESGDAITALTLLTRVGFRVDYVEDTDLDGRRRRLAAAFLGNIRLIDNVTLDQEPAGPSL